MTKQNENLIHGHEVIEIIAASGKTWTRDNLIIAIHQKFGTDARFHTCSSNNMTAAELIDFLETRGKLVDDGDGITANGGGVCNH